MAILTVGTSGQYSTIAAAAAAAQAGDTVQVQAGTYTNDFVDITKPLTLVGVGGTVYMVATVSPPDGKAIMTVDASATVQNFDFSGAKVPDGNGAGIRYEGGDLTLENDSFHDNENGLLSSALPDGHLTINNSTFYHNGNGVGNTHNLYVGDIDTLVITNSTFRDAVVGHEIKSRAQNTVIENNVIADGPDGDTSYSIDLPNGGNALIKDNVIEKGPMAENQTIIHYGGESIAYAGSSLTITGNTVTNDLTAHSTILLTNSTPIKATISDNTFLGVPIDTYVVGPATMTNNRTASGAIADSTSNSLGATGSTLYVADDADHTVVLNNTGMGIQAAGGHLTATGFSHETVIGGSGGITWNGQDGADQLYTAANSVNVLNLGKANNQVQSQGTDTIWLNSGNNSIDVSGTATLSGGTGSNAINVSGSAVISNTGVDSITLGATGNLVATETNVTYINSNGGTFSLSHQSANEQVADQITVVGGAASLMAQDTSVNVTMGGGSHGAQITLGTGTFVVASSGADTITTGAGSDTLLLSGSAQVYAGTAALSVFGRGINGQASVYGGTGTVTLDGDSGNIRYIAGASNATVNDRLSRTTVQGGAGLLTVNAMAGMLTVEGGSGGLVVNDGGGGQVVTTAAGSSNTLNMLGGATVNSNGRDLVNLLNAGNSQVTANAGGAATILGGTGTNNYVLNGNDVLTARSGGLERTTVGSTGNVRMTSTSLIDSINVQGGHLHYTAQSAASVKGEVGITGWASLDHSDWSGTSVATAAGQATRVSTTAAARVYSYGNDTISGGAGFLTTSLSGSSEVRLGAGGGNVDGYGSTTVSAGAGAATVNNWNGSLHFTGGSGDAQVYIWGGSGTVSAGSGNMTLVGGNGTMLTGGTGSTVFNGRGDDTVTVGAGAMTVNAAGWGADTLVLVAGQAHGATVVNNFDNSQDRIVLSGYAAGAASTSTTANGTQLTLSDGTSVLFTGVSHLTGFA